MRTAWPRPPLLASHERTKSPQQAQQWLNRWINLADERVARGMLRTLLTSDPMGAKVIIDATKKWEYPAISLPPRESLEQVIKNWKQYELPPLDEVQIPKDL